MVFRVFEVVAAVVVAVVMVVVVVEPKAPCFLVERHFELQWCRFGESEALKPLSSVYQAPYKLHKKASTCRGV